MVEKFGVFLEQHSDIKEYAQLKQLIRILQAKPQALKFQVKFPIPWKGVKHCTILAKYGGILTLLGEGQADVCGQILHSNIMDDVGSNSDMLKPLLDNINCYQNDEQRVQQTAHFFCTRLFKEFGIDRKPKITELPLLSSVD